MMSLINKFFSQSLSGSNGAEKTDDPQSDKLSEGMIAIASETFRFQKTLSSVLNKLSPDDQQKYGGQFSWYLKRVSRAIDDAGYRIIDLEKEAYDPGMAVTPLNLDEFTPKDHLYIEQMIEPIIMQGSSVCKTGTVLLGRIEE